MAPVPIGVIDRSPDAVKCIQHTGERLKPGAMVGLRVRGNQMLQGARALAFPRQVFCDGAFSFREQTRPPARRLSSCPPVAADAPMPASGRASSPNTSAPGACLRPARHRQVLVRVACHLRRERGSARGPFRLDLGRRLQGAMPARDSAIASRLIGDLYRMGRSSR